MKNYVAILREDRVHDDLLKAMNKVSFERNASALWVTDSGRRLLIVALCNDAAVTLQALHEVLMFDDPDAFRTLRSAHLHAAGLLEEDGIGAADAAGIILGGDDRVLTPTGRSELRRLGKFPWLEIDETTLRGKIALAMKSKKPWPVQTIGWRV